MWKDPCKSSFSPEFQKDHVSKLQWTRKTRYKDELRTQAEARWWRLYIPWIGGQLYSRAAESYWRRKINRRWGLRNYNIVTCSRTYPIIWVRFRMLLELYSYFCQTRLRLIYFCKLLWPGNKINSRI